MVATGGDGPRAAPRFRKGAGLPQKGGAFLPADPDCAIDIPAFRQKRGAFALRLGRVEAPTGHSA